MPPETTDRSLDNLAAGLPDELRQVFADLLIEAARVQNEVLNDGNRSDGMAEVFRLVHSLKEDLQAEVERGVKEVDAERAEAEKARLLAEGYKMLQEDVGPGGQLVISWDIADGFGSVDLSMEEIADLAGSGKVEMRIAGRDGVEGSGAFNLLTKGGAAVMAMVDHDAKVVTLLFEAGNLPNAPEARRMIAKEFESAAAVESPVKYKSVGKFRVADLMSEVTNGNVSVVRRPFGDEHPRGSEVLRLSTADGTNFNCLLTPDGEDVKIEIYFPRG